MATSNDVSSSPTRRSRRVPPHAPRPGAAPRVRGARRLGAKPIVAGQRSDTRSVALPGAMGIIVGRRSLPETADAAPSTLESRPRIPYAKSRP